MTERAPTAGSNDELAARWLADLRVRLSGSESVDTEILDEVLELTCDGDDLDRAWQFITALLRRASDDELCAIGADPLETLLREHGERLTYQVQAAASSDPRFRSALLCLIPHGSIAPIVDQVRGLDGSGGDSVRRG